MRKKYYKRRISYSKTYFSDNANISLQFREGLLEDYLSFKDDPNGIPSLILYITLLHYDEDIKDYKPITKYKRVWFNKNVTIYYYKNFIYKFMNDVEYRKQFLIEGNHWNDIIRMTTHNSRKAKETELLNRNKPKPLSKYRHNLFYDDINMYRITFIEGTPDEYKSAKNNHNDIPTLLINIHIDVFDSANPEIYFNNDIDEYKSFARYKYILYNSEVTDRFYYTFMRNFLADQTFRDTLFISGTKWDGCVIPSDKRIRNSDYDTQMMIEACGVGYYHEYCY